MCIWGLNAAKRKVYLAGIKHYLLVLLIRSFTDKIIIQSRGRKDSKSEKGKRFVFVSILQWFLTVFLPMLSLQLCGLRYFSLLNPGIFFLRLHIKLN